MFEDLQIEKNISFRTVIVKISGNPFSLKAIIGDVDGKFHGVSFIEAFKNGHAVTDTGVQYNEQYGIIHYMDGDDAARLSAVCEKLSSSIEDAYGIQFDDTPSTAEDIEPVPPVDPVNAKTEGGEDNE